MTLAISTSSPVASVALIGSDGSVLIDLRREANRAASRAIAELASQAFAESQVKKSDLTRVVVDVGPGGFTSVRVGVTFAKVLAWSLGIPLASVTSFDLFDSEKSIAFPSKKGEWFFRAPNEVPGRIDSLDGFDGVGYGLGMADEMWPIASVTANFLGHLPSVSAVDVVPLYLAEPSISTPKKSHVLSLRENHAGS